MLNNYERISLIKLKSSLLTRIFNCFNGRCNHSSSYHDKVESTTNVALLFNICQQHDIALAERNIDFFTYVMMTCESIYNIKL